MLIVLAVLLFANCMLPIDAYAATLVTPYIRLNRMSAGSFTTFRLQIRPATSGATSVSIDFNGADAGVSWTTLGGNLGAQGSQTDSGTACATETGDTALPGAHTFTVTGGSSNVLNINSVTALSNTLTYCTDLTFASAIKTPTTAGEYHPVITAGSDSATVAVRVVTNDSVVVTAVVPPSFNLVLNSNVDTITGTTATAVGASAGTLTATVNTNAKAGWLLWAKDSNTGLTSTLASKTIASTTPGTLTTLSAGTEGYAFGITSINQGTAGGGTATPATAYDASTQHGSGLDGTFRQIAQSTGTAGNAVLNLKERAAVTSMTPAATDYTDTITIIGAGRY